MNLEKKHIKTLSEAQDIISHSDLAITLNRFKELFAERCNKINLLDLGEDSVRYDFFIALSETKHLNPSDIQLEYPINEKAYNKRNNPKSRRKEKPQIDLVVDTNQLKLNVEFGLFRQNSNEEGTINKTAKTVKMLNDMIRLGLDSYNTERKSFFICVADYTMIGHRLQSNILGKFPSDYPITKNLIAKQKEKKTSAFDPRFLGVFNVLNLTISSKIIFNQEIYTKEENKEKRIIVWEVIAVEETVGVI